MIYSTAEAYQSPVLQYDSKGLWKVVEEYTQEWGNKNKDFLKRLFIAPGFEYDKASAPRWLPPVICRYDEVWEGPTLWHDKIYSEKGVFRHLDVFRFETKTMGIWRVDPGAWRRSQADEWLRYDGVLAGASPAEALKFKIAVQLYPPNWFKGF